MFSTFHDIVIKAKSYYSLSKVVFCLLVLHVLLLQTAIAQEEQAYDEIVITLNVHRIGNVDVPAVIKGNDAYLSIRDVFDFLKIRNTMSPDMDSVHGYIIKPSAVFVIESYNSLITYQNKVYNLKPDDLIKTESNLFLKTNFFGEVFGLDCQFEFRSLSVLMKSRIDLPAILEMKQTQMRHNISQLKGEIKADTIIKRKYPVFALGTADWSVFSSQVIKGVSSTRLNLNLGAMVAGGEATAFLNYVSDAPFKLSQQFYRWRYVDNDKKLLKQISLGNVYAQTTATINSVINGVQFTNTPTTYKKDFGSFTLSNKTDPDWTVELYINNVLVNYTKADASGFFTFEVPVVYGSSQIKLRHISPWGEERIVEEVINIPYNFVPARQFEYMVTAGVLTDATKSRFSRAHVSYGLNNRVTIGAGVEYLSSIVEDKMPFINASIRVGSNIVFSGEHANKVRSRAVITYKLPSNLQLDVTYIKYDPSQRAINTNFLEERKAVLSFPVRFKKFSSFYRFTYNQIIVPKDKLTNAEILMSANFLGMNANLTTNGFFSLSQNLNIVSSLSLAYRLPKGWRISPQVQYEYVSKKLNSVKSEIEKSVFKNGFLNASYEKFFISKNQVINVGLRYNFSAAQAMFSVRRNNDIQSYNQSARGSLLYVGGDEAIKLSNQNVVGRGGLHLKAFLDLNNNGKRDALEPLAAGLKFNIRGGRVTQNLKDTSATVTSLESYAKYLIQVDKNCFDNIAWVVKKPVISVTVEPNHFKTIEIPVLIVGEISGMVYLDDNNGRKGQGRVIVNVYDTELNVVAKVLSEADGYFNYIGLPPGKYSLGVDANQLNKLKLKSASKLIFSIKPLIDGDVVNSLNIVLQPLNIESLVETINE